MRVTYFCGSQWPWRNYGLLRLNAPLHPPKMVTIWSEFYTAKVSEKCNGAFGRYSVFVVQLPKCAHFALAPKCSITSAWNLIPSGPLASTKVGHPPLTALQGSQMITLEKDLLVGGTWLPGELDGKEHRQIDIGWRHLWTKIPTINGENFSEKLFMTNKMI